MRKGFTLIELVVVIALTAILITVYFLAANPGGQLAQSRNTERKLHLQTIMQAIVQNIADSSSGQFSCSFGPLTTSSRKMASVGANTYNIAPCLLPPNGSIIYTMPFDPSASSSHYISPADYDTGYNIQINASGTLVILSAPYAEKVNGTTTVVSVSGW